MLRLIYESEEISRNSSYTNPLSVNIQGDSRVERVSDPLTVRLSPSGISEYTNIQLTFESATKGITWEASLSDQGPWAPMLTFDTLVTNDRIFYLRVTIAPGLPAKSYRDLSMKATYTTIVEDVPLQTISWDLAVITPEIEVGGSLTVQLEFDPPETTHKLLTAYSEQTGYTVEYDNLNHRLIYTGDIPGIYTISAEADNGQVLSGPIQVYVFGNRELNPFAYSGVDFTTDTFKKMNLRSRTLVDGDTPVGEPTADDVASYYAAADYGVLAITDRNVTTWPYTIPDGLVAIPANEWDPSLFGGSDDPMIVLFNPTPPGDDYTLTAPGDLVALLAETSADGAYLVIPNPGDTWDLEPGDIVPAATITKYTDVFDGNPHVLGIEVSSMNDYPEDVLLWEELLKIYAPQGRNILGFANDLSLVLDGTTQQLSWNTIKMPSYAVNGASQTDARDVIQTNMVAGNFTFSEILGTPADLTQARLEVPEVTTLSFLNGVATISATSNGVAVDPANISWISGGVEVATGDTFNFREDLTVQTNQYFRVEIRTADSVTYTQAVLTEYLKITE